MLKPRSAPGGQARPRRLLCAVVAATGLVTGLAACGSAARPADDPSLLVWSLDAQPDRVAATKDIAAEFTRRTGVPVEIVGIDEAQFPQLIAGAAQTDRLPDVIGSVPLGLAQQLDQQEILDRAAATQVIDGLNRGTFEPAALELTKQGGQNMAVPSDAWAQILIYRKDLFAAAGLEPPATYAALEKAAATLTTGKQKGITLATDPSDAFTQQSFESLALGNGCELVGADGEVGLDAPSCQGTFDLYGRLATDYAPSGAQDVDTTRASYFAGQSAMVLWSTFILDELAGLREDAKPTCPQCVDDPTWLAENSGVVTSFSGPNGSGTPEGFGEVASWAITKGPRTGNASAFVRHMMSEGYMASIAIAPEGRVPVRRGDAPGSDAYLRRWGDLPAGVDTKKPLSEIYGKDVMNTLQDTPARMRRWAIPEGHGKVLGPVTAELPVSKAVSALSSGSLTPQQAASESAEAVREITSGMKG